MEGKHKKNIKTGMLVDIIQKEHQRTGELTEGIVKRILTKSSYHPHGIKVLLEGREVGRVQNIIEDEID